MTNKIVKGVAVIGIAGIIVKFLGAFFRIPLTNWIGDVGMSYYGYAYAIYSVLLILATAGMPIAISRLVSENIGEKKYRNAHKVFKLSLMLMIVIGLLSSSIGFFGSGPITAALGNPDAKMAVRGIAPALLIVPIVAAFRGYFQGRQNMNPTAISEVAEQLTRVIVGLILAFTLLSAGLKSAAAGAAFGASAGAFGGLLIIIGIYMLNRPVIKKKISLNDPFVEPSSVIIKKIVAIAVPIIIGSEIMPIMGLIDTSIIMTRLRATGWTYGEAKALFGLISGFCSSLIAFPQIFTQGVAISLVPAIAQNWILKNREKVRDNIKLGYIVTMVMAFPCALGIFALAKPILLLLYPMQRESAIEAVPALMIMSIGVISLALSQTSTGVLQAIGRQGRPVWNLLVGCLFKIIITFILVGIPWLNIKGAAIGTTVAETVSFMLNSHYVKKYTGVRFDYIRTYVKPFAAASIMAICAYVIQKICLSIIGSNTLSTMVAILAGAAIYGMLIIFLKVVDIEDIKKVKGGRKIAIFAEKLMKKTK